MKFADTSWWVAWALPGDARHRESLAMLASLGASEQVLTTNLVTGETWTFLRRRDSHQAAVAFLDRVERLAADRRLVVHRVSAEEEAAAWKWLRRRDERRYSFVDATSFQVMRGRRLRDGLACDLDFAAAGFIVLAR